MPDFLIHGSTINLPRMQGLAQAAANIYGNAGTIFLSDAPYLQNKDFTRLAEKTAVVLFLDLYPIEEMLSGLPHSLPKVFIYTANFDRASSFQVQTWLDQHDHTCYWERIRRNLEETKARFILLPPLLTGQTSRKNPVNGRNPRPLVGTLRPLLEQHECRALQQEYYCRSPRKSHLLIMTPSGTLTDFEAKTSQTDLWFFPKVSPFPIWSFELSHVLFHGGRIAHANAPESLQPYILSVSDYNALEQSLFAIPAQSADRSLYQSIINLFFQTINLTDLK